ncbi:MAG TPA: 2-C-methyl-D-erythritol 2,4-cyclodiphosphate synthase [Actinomycetota bacterium]|nr:2-C-methyl-D-erythritol 2,4-cyclodiphosphate synthase [Actinomycetota bacterium]
MPEQIARSGLGFDVHRFSEHRPLWLGGVLFDNEDGLVGHSDGDVVCHAVADALLGAAALGDLGEHFPDSDPSIEGIEGRALLRETVRRVVEAGYAPTSVDVTLICERPSIAPRREEMRTEVGACLGVSLDRVSVKATRPEGLGLAGDGVGCLAIATIG